MVVKVLNTTNGNLENNENNVIAVLHESKAFIWGKNKRPPLLMVLRDHL